MPNLAIYDTMVMLQWAALPRDPARQHATIRLLSSGAVRLAMSQPLLEEIRDVFGRPESQQKFPTLTPAHSALILNKTLEYSDWFETVPNRFSLPGHPDDDHLFNLAIESGASYLVTLEDRLLTLQDSQGANARRLRELANGLRILTPPQLAQTLK